MGVPNKLAEFVDLVKRMRQAQKDYFKYRYPIKLTESKQLEHSVDSWISRHCARSEPSETETQNTLF